MSKSEKNGRPQKDENYWTSQGPRSIDVNKNNVVSISNLQQGGAYHFSLKKQGCREGVYDSQSRIKIDREERLIKLSDGSLILESQVIEIHPLTYHRLPTK